MGGVMVLLDREFQVLMMELGYIFMGMRRYQEAKEVFEGLSVFSPNSDVPLVALGGVSFCMGKFKDAIASYKKAMKVDPESLYAKVYLAEAQFFNGEKKEAVAGLKEVGIQDPKGPVGGFAKALLGAIDQGFTPEVLSGSKEIRKMYEKQT